MVKIRRIASTSSGSSNEDDDSVIETSSTGNDSEKGGHRQREHGSGGEEEEEADDDDEKGCAHCTYAVTGNTPTFQAIFVCHECCNPNSTTNDNADPEPLCICQACAEACHADHDDEVEYIGMGPCYCDCDQLGECSILQKSNQEAERLGMYPKSLKEQEEIMINSITTNDNNSNENKDTITVQEENQDPHHVIKSEEFVQDAYHIPLLMEQSSTEKADDTTMITTTSCETVTDWLIEQARELIQHSKETHWVDQTMVDNDGKNVIALCPLERLAWSIFQRHVQHYNLSVGGGGGAEWWVQVKPTKNTQIGTSAGSISTTNAGRSNRSKNKNNENSQADQAIDLHYDKDEALAESFGVGLFPTFSTVTYLTAKTPETSASVEGSQSNHNPTLVFPHMYHQGEEEIIPSMLLSRPIPGKHLVFDGRLLHGAPSHPSLLLSPSATQDIVEKDQTSGSPVDKKQKHDENKVSPSLSKKLASITLDNTDKKFGNASSAFRVTFLVNLWIHRRPTNVKPLDPTVRQALQQQQQQQQRKEHQDETTTTSTHSWLFLTPSDRPDDQKPCHSPLTMIPRSITKVTVFKEEDLPSQFQSRIELPFVCKGITWDEDDYDDSPGLVLTTFPPPECKADTLMVQFGPGMQAYLEYLRDEEDSTGREDPSSEEKVSNNGGDYRNTIQDYYV